MTCVNNNLLEQEEHKQNQIARNTVRLLNVRTESLEEDKFDEMSYDAGSENSHENSVDSDDSDCEMLLSPSI